jgi:hypothetical protein
MRNKNINYDNWPNCTTPDCENKICLWAQKGLCAKCTKKRFGQAYMDNMYEKTHYPDGSPSNENIKWKFIQ